MDSLLLNVVVAFVLEAIATPVIVYLMQRATGKKLDAFDRKREEARARQEEEMQRNAEWRRAMTGGMRSMLRSELLHEHTKWTKRGYCPLESKEYAQRTYESYHSLGGNGIGTSMYEDIMALPLAPRET